MGFIITAMMGVFIIPIVAGIVMSKKSKKISMILFSIPFIFVIGVLVWWVYEINDRFVSNTDLASEQIEPFELLKEIDEKTLDSYGSFDEKEDRYFDQMLAYDDFSLGIDHEGNLIYIEIREEGYETSLGINVGDSIDQVEEMYGTNTYTSKEMGIGVSKNYVDRDEKKHIKFFEEDGKITQITLFKK